MFFGSGYRLFNRLDEFVQIGGFDKELVGAFEFSLGAFLFAAPGRDYKNGDMAGLGISPDLINGLETIHYRHT